MEERVEGLLCPPALREAVSHDFASQNMRSTEAEVNSSDNGNTHVSIDKSTNFGVGFLPLLGEPDR